MVNDSISEIVLKAHTIIGHLQLVSSVKPLKTEPQKLKQETKEGQTSMGKTRKPLIRLFRQSEFSQLISELKPSASILDLK